jgi:hypothetical protein
VNIFTASTSYTEIKTKPEHISKGDKVEIIGDRVSRP